MSDYLNEKKEEDLQLARDTLVSIIKDNLASHRDRENACKTLLRAHKALQVDRSVKDKEEDIELSNEEQDDIEKILQK